MKKVYSTLLIWLSVTVACAQDTITINPAIKYQTIKGWGGEGGQNTQYEGTPAYLIKQVINESVKDLGLDGLRYKASLPLNIHSGCS